MARSLYERYPKINYKFKNVDGEIEIKKLTDINIKYGFSDSRRRELTAYYPYTYKETDRVENISYLYYGSTYDFWLLMMSNNHFDIHTDLAVSDRYLDDILYRKYRKYAIEQYDYSIDINEPDAPILYEESNPGEDTPFFQDTKYDVYRFIKLKIKEFYDPEGCVIDVYTYRDTPGCTYITYYDWEVKQNDEKRNILLVKNQYRSDFYKELQEKLGEFRRYG